MARGRKKKPEGGRIRHFRRGRGLTQTELGDLVGASQRVIAYYEGKGVPPPPDLLVKIADALDVWADVLLGRKKAHEQVGEPGFALRRLRRMKRLEELPRDDLIAVLKMIDALADRFSKRKAGA